MGEWTEGGEGEGDERLVNKDNEKESERKKDQTERDAPRERKEGMAGIACEKFLNVDF